MPNQEARMKPDDLLRLLEEVASAKVAPMQALEQLKTLPFENLEFARVDHHRALRTGAPEIVLGHGKTAEQIAPIVEAISARDHPALVTRIDAPLATAVVNLLSSKRRDVAKFEPVPRLLLVGQPTPLRGRGTIAVVTAGTSDIPVAEEAARTAEILGNKVERVFDVGIAGLHRVAAHRNMLDDTEVVIVVAGMEGALPSVVAGLISRPVIAVPTSVGVGGTNFGGMTPLLAMLNSCASGITVVNVDNGFGAGFAASLINAPRRERLK